MAVTILTRVKKQVPEVGWADLMQMGSAIAVEVGHRADNFQRLVLSTSFTYKVE